MVKSQFSLQQVCTPEREAAAGTFPP